MSLILKEHEWAESMIRSKSLGEKPKETLRRVARYYIDKGCSKKDTRDILDSFLLQCEPTSSLSKWSGTLDFAVSFAARYDAVDIDSIDITDAEMERIDLLDGKQIRRLAFTLLCLAKYWDIVKKSPDHWVKSKDNEIMRMANINTSVKRQCSMYYNLHVAGMIQFSKKVDSTDVKVCFVEDGETILHITDFRNLGYQYLMYHGEPYFVCCNCGITTKINNSKIGSPGRKQKYCPACAIEIAAQQRINRIMKLR